MGIFRVRGCFREGRTVCAGRIGLVGGGVGGGLRAGLTGFVFMGGDCRCSSREVPVCH